MALETSFFPGTYREIVVEDYKQLKSKGTESRKKLIIRNPLGEGDSIIGMPQWVAINYETVAKASAHTNRCKIDVKLNGMTIEVYATPQSQRSLLLTNTVIKDFYVERVGIEEKARFFMIYAVYTPDSKALHDWLREMYKMTAFFRFEATQLEIGPGDEATDQDAEARQPANLTDKYFDNDFATEEDKKRMAKKKKGQPRVQ